MIANRLHWFGLGLVALVLTSIPPIQYLLPSVAEPSQRHLEAKKKYGFSYCVDRKFTKYRYM